MGKGCHHLPAQAVHTTHRRQRRSRPSEWGNAMDILTFGVKCQEVMKAEHSGPFEKYWLSWNKSGNDPKLQPTSKPVDWDLIPTMRSQDRSVLRPKQASTAH